MLFLFNLIPGFPLDGGRVLRAFIWGATHDTHKATIIAANTGRLIAYGLADASICPDGGLLPNGWASACGLETARESVDAWQNRFNAQIIAAAQEFNLPAQLLKNLFAQESQFWPGAVRDLKIQEFGMGHLTEQGADAVLLWNPDFFARACICLCAIRLRAEMVFTAATTYCIYGIYVHY